MFQGLILNYIKFYLVQSLVFLIQICIVCKWPNQSRVLKCNVVEFFLHVLRTLNVFMLGVYITLIIFVGLQWCIQISDEGNVTSYNLFDSCSIKMWFHIWTAQIYVTFSSVRLWQISFFCFGHEIESPILFLDIWTHIWKKLFVNWRQFYNLSNTLRK